MIDGHVGILLCLQRRYDERSYDSMVVAARTTGHDENGGEDRQRHERRPDPF